MMAITGTASERHVTRAPRPLALKVGTFTGAGLRHWRRTLRLTQHGLAQMAGIGRHAVQYHEAKERLDWSGWAVQQMAAALEAREVEVQPINPVIIRAGQRVICGAKTRKGTPCRCKSEPGRRRCKFHGGMSTGPKTLEGRERIAQAQRRRWAALKSNRPKSSSMGCYDVPDFLGCELAAETAVASSA